MKRDIRKAHEDYKKFVKRNKGILYLSDYEQIAEMCKGDVVKMVCTGLEVGIVIGYRLAKREGR